MGITYIPRWESKNTDKKFSYGLINGKHKEVVDVKGFDYFIGISSYDTFFKFDSSIKGKEYHLEIDSGKVAIVKGNRKVLVIDIADVFSRVKKEKGSDNQNWTLSQDMLTLEKENEQVWVKIYFSSITGCCEENGKPKVGNFYGKLLVKFR